MRGNGGAIRGLFGRAFLAGALLALLVPVMALAVPPKYFVITDPRLDTATGDIVVRLGVTCDNVTGLFEMLKDGASVELVIGGRVERVRSLWTNVTITERRLVSVLQHNPLTREFSLYMPGEAQPLMDKNLERLLDATWSKLVINFGPLSMLDGEEKGAEYRAVLELALQHAKVPPWLEKNFVFWSRNVLDPETVTLPFTR